MKKAITVTPENKALNPYWLKDENIGKHKVFNASNFPNNWSMNVMINEDNFVKNFTDFKTRSELHEIAGFYPVVNPVINPALEKIGTELSFDAENSRFVYDVVPLSEQEQTDYLENQENEDVEQFVSNHELSGQSEIRYISRMLKKLQNKGTLTENQYNQARSILFDALIPLYFGQWDICETKLNQLQEPNNATLLNVLNAIKTRVSNYISNGVRDEESKSKKSK